MRIIKAFGAAGALIVAAVVGGTLIGPVFAIDEATDGSEADAGAYCDVFMDSLAAELGVSRDDVVAASRAAANAAIDAAVAAGDLAEERAEAHRDRVARYDGEGCAWLGRAGAFARGFHHGLGHGLARGILGGDGFEAAGDVLGLSTSELLRELRAAGSLQALAEAEDVSYADVKASVLSTVQRELDAAVADGMSRERADLMLERITSWLDEGGEVPARPGPGRGHGVGAWGSN